MLSHQKPCDSSTLNAPRGTVGAARQCWAQNHVSIDVEAFLFLDIADQNSCLLWRLCNISWTRPWTDFSKSGQVSGIDFEAFGRRIPEDMQSAE